MIREFRRYGVFVNGFLARLAHKDDLGKILRCMRHPLGRRANAKIVVYDFARYEHKERKPCAS